ncbi:hypothetical protein CYFUS_002617 [Cystobacter fuscus]|uniref:Uncharacterized protein n=1 Tax=Cystobacter fuscus TaxID=43 RepID=A0A250J223_9BACT|nr:hypothetical protein CYFUS_002617 [Cystobacter fuscus]
MERREGGEGRELCGSRPAAIMYDGTRPGLETREPPGGGMKKRVKSASLVVTTLMAAAVGALASTWTSQDSEFASGYCTVDCSQCGSSLECQRRGAGSCTQIRACFNPSQE